MRSVWYNISPSSRKYVENSQQNEGKGVMNRFVQGDCGVDFDQDKGPQGVNFC